VRGRGELTVVEDVFPGVFVAEHPFNFHVFFVFEFGEFAQFG
jgi:hypothetical protein